jgi:hypothetical protein
VKLIKVNGRQWLSIFIIYLQEGSKMVKERRKRTRVPVDFDINIIFQHRKIRVKTFNISLTGISCTGNPLFRADEPCEISLSLNAETNLIIAGKIIRLDEKEAIISFISMDEDTFYHLKRLLQYNAADPDSIEKELKNPAFVEFGNEDIPRSQPRGKRANTE